MEEFDVRAIYEEFIKEKEQRDTHMRETEPEKEPRFQDVLREAASQVVECHREVLGYGMGQERILTVLFYAESIGYFCVQQTTSNAGDCYRYQVLPRSEGKPQVTKYLGDEGYSGWVVNEWFLPWIRNDMLR